MPLNLPGPYELEFDLLGWTSPVRGHKVRCNVAVVGTPTPGTPFASIILQKAGGGTITAQAASDQVWSYLRLNYNTAIYATSVTLWKYVVGTTAKDFVSSSGVANPTGSSASASVVAGQTTLSYRTANGGVMKQVLLETVNAGNTRSAFVPNPAGNSLQRVGAYVLSVDNVLLGRDDSFPIAPMRASFGENELLFKKIYRS